MRRRNARAAPAPARRLVRTAVALLRSRTTIDRIASWVEEEQPDLRRASAPDGTVTMLFSDIENSTRLSRPNPEV